MCFWGGRIKLRLNLESYDRAVLLEYLEHGLAQAGALHLMPPGLMETLIDHAVGNLRVLNKMAAELLISGAQKELIQLDERLFLEMFAPDTANYEKTQDCTANTRFIQPGQFGNEILRDSGETNVALLRSNPLRDNRMGDE